MKVEEVNRCQIQEWYPKFKSVSIRTKIHELPESFVDYLLDDYGSVYLPISVSKEDLFPKLINNPDEEEDYQTSEGSGNETEESSPPPSFPDLELRCSLPQAELELTKRLCLDKHHSYPPVHHSYPPVHHFQ